MKRFKFRLQKLYTLRKEEERQSLLIVQTLRQKEIFFLRNLDEVRQERGLWCQKYNKAGQSGNSAEISLIEDYLSALEKQETELSLACLSIEKEIQKALEEVQKTYQARRQVEHLKDKQKSNYEEELRRLERRSVDEWNALRFNQDAKRDEVNL